MQRTGLLALAVLMPLLAANDAPKPAEPITVERGEIKIELELDAVVEAREMTPVEVRLEGWKSPALTVIKAVAQGQKVRKGETLVVFDTEDLDKAIRDAELGVAGAQVALETARHSHTHTERSVEMDRREAQQAYDRAKQDLEYWEKISRPLNVKSTHNRLKQSEYNLEYAMEELKQLSRMYKEDDLTEETEEIILTRQERSVENARDYLESAQASYTLTLETTLPRQDQDIRDRLEKQKIDLDRSLATLPLRLESSRQALAKAQNAYDDAVQNLKLLREDREAMNLKAPAGGIVYYGRCERGRWLEGQAVAKSLEPKGTIRPGTVFLTIVEPAPLAVRADIPDGQLEPISEGQEGWFTLPAAPFDAYVVKARDISPIPGSPTQYSVAATGSSLDALKPGLTGKLKFVIYENADALTVPLTAVKSDTPGEHHVFVKSDNGYKRQAVRLGKRDGNKVEILDGLEAGDQIHPKGEPEA